MVNFKWLVSKAELIILPLKGNVRLISTYSCYRGKYLEVKNSEISVVKIKLIKETKQKRIGEQIMFQKHK